MSRFKLYESSTIGEALKGNSQASGVDVRQVIMAENVERRHMTKGARAMAVAMLYPEPAKGGKRNKGGSFRN
ncbi:hypothetical protein CWR43_30810 [Rhizobium sullae]|uniref:Uncharacterized protein n=1 Tax=Rhizobium sullae TaxID=50338 RepID=A0A2N0D0N1_RHISU|nr:hypothetical protein [Rhizobium sullae]PKA39659.1 hypothetical protein CWR43_30810 [Rhizobium sullae]